ncbi:MAG: YbhB/YbcL family Raf kinase inhibitor-like protein [Clostridia bacterium]|nr:YbhB/YbcL family Raf kinase inhibitor-like protein [Clostridia bacterium]
MSAFFATSGGIVEGKFLDKYGKRGETDCFGMPLLSPPINIYNRPKDTACYALILDDDDAIPVCGYSFVHWLAADILVEDLPEGVSGQGFFVEGTNDYAKSHGAGDCARYGGMAPPNAPHVYRIHVFALDRLTGLKKGFSLEELRKAMDGHVLSSCVIEGVYDD